ncbi:hypothetical protein HANVADRAFT_26694 [Hanseniaspora valbyensis NRRL Y-1626]|uniref:Palmitoyltransferase n=1 Tax=Hanseniaspora valbyensis NRRL Y-1626 TaxID=766949 RepID=A0A1B7TAB4_9ASCO|nr:hypothetical protein HANVADRAFT_26694 [Hanseniaspora valbyensis NRRL Y-1626]
MLYYIVLFGVILNCFLLLLSPIYHHKSRVLHWYYTKIFKKITSATNNNNKYICFINWLVPIFYCGLIILLGALYYIKIATEKQFTKTLINISKFENFILIPTLLILNLGLVVICHYKSYKFNKKSIKAYPFDNILYSENTLCRTCNKNKLARSKHCSKCNTCIPGEDHHCIWLNCCISDSNYKYFDWLLLSNLFGLIYASIRSGLIMFSFKFFKKNILTIFILTFCFSLVLTWFIYTQVELIFDGMTSNESDKWFIIHSLINEKIVYKINNKMYILADDDSGSKTRFNSINFYDKRVFIFENITENNLIKSAYEIDNIYDSHSFLKNLKQRWNW